MFTNQDGLRMLEAEQSASYQRQQRLAKTPIEILLAEGEILGPVRGIEVEGSRATWIEATGFYCKFRKGDRIVLHRHLGSNKLELHAAGLEIKEVRYPARGVIHLALTRKRKPEERPQPGIEYFVYQDSNSFADELLVNALEEAGDGSMFGRGDLLLPSSHLESGILEGMNHCQHEALQHLCDQTVGGAVQGPPGTGKTKMLRAIVRSALESGLRVGLTAFTHAAVDNALCGLTPHLIPRQGVRIGQKLKIKDSLYDDPTWLKQHTATRFGCLENDPQLIAATCHSWVLNTTAPALDLLVVDEAGQVPAYMAPLLGQKATRIICLGDHKQLAPVLQADHRREEFTDMFSMFREEYSPMLDVQYRMNHDIQSWSAMRYYDGRLRPDDSNAERDVLRGVAPGILGRAPVQLATHRHGGSHNANQGEAQMVADRVEQLLVHGDLQPVDIGVIAPHRMHNGAIIQALQDRLGVDRGSSIQVDTVERFQGQEKEVILYSIGVSSTANMNKASGEFLADPRRINVAVTRARSRFVCLASDALRASLEKSVVGSPEKELGEFLGWCDGKVGHVEEEVVGRSVAL